MHICRERKSAVFFQRRHVSSTHTTHTVLSAITILQIWRRHVINISKNDRQLYAMKKKTLLTSVSLTVVELEAFGIFFHNISTVYYIKMNGWNRYGGHKHWIHFEWGRSSDPFWLIIVPSFSMYKVADETKDTIFQHVKIIHVFHPQKTPGFFFLKGHITAWASFTSFNERKR